MSPRPLLASVISLAAISILGACSSAPQEPIPVFGAEEDPSTAATWAMTGLPGAQGGVRRSVFAVKIDNTPPGRAQQGLGVADVVVQEPIEGGETRLAAFYESASPELVGPVRSIRTSDFGFVKPANATLVASGGSPVALRGARKAGVAVLQEGSTGFFRDPSRAAPYNLFVNLQQVRQTGGGEPPKRPYFEFGDFNPPAGAIANQIDVTFSDAASERWNYDGTAARWIRAGGGGFAAKTLLMLRVEVRDAGYRDPAGNRVPEVVTTGEGNGWLAVGQQIRRIRWSKRSENVRWSLTTESGLAIELPPGKSWISLLPKATGSVDSE